MTRAAVRSFGHSAGVGGMAAVPPVSMAVAKDLLEHPERAVPRRLVPAVALIGVGEHVEIGKRRDQRLEPFHVHEPIVPGDDDEGSLDPGRDHIDVVTPQAIVEPLPGSPGISAALILIVDIGGTVVDVTLDDHETLVQVADPALTAEPDDTVPHRSPAEQADLISIAPSHEVWGEQRSVQTHPLGSVAGPLRERAGDRCPEAQAADVEPVDLELSEQVEEHV